MIRVVKYANNHVQDGQLEDIKKGKRFLWVDSLNPTKKELESISQKTGVPLTELNEVLDKGERPRFSQISDKISLIVFRGPFFEEHHITTTPIAIFILENLVVTIRFNEFKSIENIHSLHIDHKKMLFKEGASYFCFRLLDEILNTYFEVLDQLDEEIDKVETKIFRKPDEKIVEKIFMMKKTLIYFHKSLSADREVITGVEKGYLKQIKKKEQTNFRILYNDATQLIDVEGIYRDVITGVLDTYLSAISNNLNIVIKKMTAYASFILIPTLISGIYGMNFSKGSPLNMPELYWKYGYFFALGLMVVSVGFMYMVFKKKDWL